jgi:hypothetical protein
LLRGWNACTFEWAFARIPPQSDGNNIKKWMACVRTANGQKQRHFPKSKLVRIWIKKPNEIWELGRNSLLLQYHGKKNYEKFVD